MNILSILGIIRRVDSLVGLDAKYEKAILALRLDIDDLKSRLIRLEAREDIVVAEAKAAAGTAAGVAASGYMSDIARRVGILETLAGQSGSPRLSPT